MNPSLDLLLQCHLGRFEFLFLLLKVNVSSERVGLVGRSWWGGGLTRGLRGLQLSQSEVSLTLRFQHGLSGRARIGAAQPGLID